jgi:hypothetical protein
MNSTQFTASVVPILGVVYLGVMVVVVARSRDVFSKAMAFLGLLLPPVCWYSVSRKTLSHWKLPYIPAVILSTVWTLLMLVLISGLMGIAMYNRQFLALAALLTWILPVLVLCKSFSNNH